ncbi:MAG: FixH family protein [Pseudomonadota bacterium]|nr:FixH family protein [Pseudomonadota bacterium]
MSHASLPLADERPWYRYPLLWLAILLPASSVIAGLTTLYIAIINADSPVVDEWYKEGRGINRSVEQEQLARRLGVGLTISQTEDGTVAALASSAAIPAPASLTLALRHPTLKEKDVTVTLQKQQAGHYSAIETLPTQGRFTATVSTPQEHWRLYEPVQIRGATFHLGHDAGP